MVKRVRFYNIIYITQIACILNKCGKDMAQKYDLHHWHNPMIKSFVIAVLGVLKNEAYILFEKHKVVATFQVKSVGEEFMFFEKLGVMPEYSGNGYGSSCMDFIEKKARTMKLKKVEMEVYEKSQNAINFYIHKGYSIAGKKETLKYTDIIMEKEML